MILALVNDCFDTSLRLLIEKRPRFYDRGAVESFLNSTKATANKRRKKPKEDEPHIDMASLREKAKVWFEPDYRFYHAAIEQFQRHMASSNRLDPVDVAACNMKLDKRLAE